MYVQVQIGIYLAGLYTAYLYFRLENLEFSQNYSSKQDYYEDVLTTLVNTSTYIGIGRYILTLIGMITTVNYLP